MNIVDVVTLARKANIKSPDGYKLTVSHMHIEDLQRFANLVAAAEREACANICDELHWAWRIGANSGPMKCAIAIRQRDDV